MPESPDRLLLNWRVPVDRDHAGPALEEVRDLVVTLGAARADELVEFRRLHEEGATLIVVQVESGPAVGTGEVVLVAHPSERVHAALAALRAAAGDLNGAPDGHGAGSGSGSEGADAQA